MTNSIGSISGGGSNGVFWSNNSSKNNNVEDNKANEQQANANSERKDIDPDRLMQLLANQSYFVPVKAEAKSAVKVDGVDAETQDRIADYMKDFEKIFGIIEEEFGSDLAPQAFDVAMDKLLGMA